jgi:hypothetical protein
MILNFTTALKPEKMGIKLFNAYKKIYSPKDLEDLCEILMPSNHSAVKWLRYQRVISLKHK